MVTRRQFFLSSIATMSGLTTVSACSSGTITDSYEHAVSHTWRHNKVDEGNKPAVLRELVRYATLAPSSHNTQCWKFRVEDRSISVFADLSRRCPAVDPDDHHLFVSIGCATENLVQAALAYGLNGNTIFDSPSGGTLRLSLEPTKAVASALFNAIPERQSLPFFRTHVDEARPHSRLNISLTQCQFAQVSPNASVILGHVRQPFSVRASFSSGTTNIRGLLGAIVDL